MVLKARSFATSRRVLRRASGWRWRRHVVCSVYRRPSSAHDRRHAGARRRLHRGRHAPPKRDAARHRRRSRSATQAGIDLAVGLTRAAGRPGRGLRGSQRRTPVADIAAHESVGSGAAGDTPPMMMPLARARRAGVAAPCMPVSIEAGGLSDRARRPHAVYSRADARRLGALAPGRLLRPSPFPATAPTWKRRLNERQAGCTTSNAPQLATPTRCCARRWRTRERAVHRVLPGPRLPAAGWARSSTLAFAPGPDRHHRGRKMADEGGCRLRAAATTLRSSRPPRQEIHDHIARASWRRHEPGAQIAVSHSHLGLRARASTRRAWSQALVRAAAAVTARAIVAIKSGAGFRRWPASAMMPPLPATRWPISRPIEADAIPLTEPG